MCAYESNINFTFALSLDASTEPQDYVQVDWRLFPDLVAYNSST